MGFKLTFEVQNFNTIKEVKSGIGDPLCISPRFQCLILQARKELQDTRTLADYNILRKSTLRLDMSFAWRRQIFAWSC